MMRAGIPNGCAWNESAILPCNKRPTDVPNPQPGQWSKPASFKGQMVNPFIPNLTETKRNSSPASQMKASRFFNLNIRLVIVNFIQTNFDVILFLKFEHLTRDHKWWLQKKFVTE